MDGNQSPFQGHLVPPTSSSTLRIGVQSTVDISTNDPRSPTTDDRSHSTPGQGTGERRQSFYSANPESYYSHSQPRVPSSYYSRAATDYGDNQELFVVGRVVETQWAEVVGPNVTPPESDILNNNGGRIYIRRRKFVIVERGIRSCTCLAISTFKDGSVGGIDLKEHGLLYSAGGSANFHGIDKDPLKVLLPPAVSSVPWPCLVNYGRVYTVETNVKAENLGLLDTISKGHLLKNFALVFVQLKFAPEVLRSVTSLAATLERTNLEERPEVSTESSRINAQTTPASELLDPRFQFISEPTRFFKVGRVFKVLWAEPSSRNDSTRLQSKFGEAFYIKVRRFVVVREVQGCSLCLAMKTYGGQATLKSGLAPQDHAVVYAVGKEPNLLEGEKPLEKDAFPIKIENSLETVAPASRLDFGRIYTVEHNVKVCKIGRVPPEHIQRLDDYFEQSLAKKPKGWSNATGSDSPARLKSELVSKEKELEEQRNHLAAVQGALDEARNKIAYFEHSTGSSGNNSNQIEAAGNGHIASLESSNTALKDKLRGVVDASASLSQENKGLRRLLNFALTRNSEENSTERPRQKISPILKMWQSERPNTSWELSLSSGNQATGLRSTDPHAAAGHGGSSSEHFYRLHQVKELENNEGEYVNIPNKSTTQPTTPTSGGGYTGLLRRAASAFTPTHTISPRYSPPASFRSNSLSPAGNQQGSKQIPEQAKNNADEDPDLITLPQPLDPLYGQ